MHPKDDAHRAPVRARAYPPVDAVEKLRRIKHLYDWLFAHAESFDVSHLEGTCALGADAMYLVGAIVDDGVVAWDASDSLYRLFEEELPEDDVLWAYVEVSDVPPERSDP